MPFTTDPNDTRLKHGVDTEKTTQAEVYLVLSEEERKKGFTRPYRDAYIHVGLKPKYPLVDLTEEEQVRYARYGYVKREIYPESESPVTGRFWTQEMLDNLGKGCQTETIMARALSETYAIRPTFYSHTYCTGCRKHLPIAEFVWSKDGDIVGS